MHRPVATHLLLAALGSPSDAAAGRAKAPRVRLSLVGPAGRPRSLSREASFGLLPGNGLLRTSKLQAS